jgi:peroxiredoxin/predicted 2-oxoglutarate/Fe(II)-dependent dioxygenase YbiX
MSKAQAKPMQGKIPQMITPEPATPGGQRFVALSAGDPAPWFTQDCTSNPQYAFDTAAGRYIVLCFFSSSEHPDSQNALSILKSNRKLFDDKKISFFGVSFDPTDKRDGHVEETMPGIRHFWDFDGKAGKLYGVLPIEGFKPGQPISIRPRWFILDPQMRIMKVVPFRQDGNDKKEVVDFLKKLPPVHLANGLEVQAPILFLPNVFESELCEKLIGMYEANGGTDSGFMRQMGEKTVAVKDYNIKRRSDFTLTDEATIKEVRQRIRRRIIPEIQKAHAFNATHIERFLVGCYDSQTGDHFRAHRDNLTTGTAHRRFAVSINLNSDFDGGEVSFPEYGSRSFKPPVGGAVVFNCSLLHEVSAVKKGRRFAFLPFLYDEAAAKIREANAKSLQA